LILTARKLAVASPRRPRQSELRRSVSTAYYAVFHAVAKDAADLFAGVGPVRAGKAGVGPVRAGKAWRHAYRGLEHGFARNACREVSKLGFPHGITHCANEFVELQEARHDADYDPKARLTRAEALQWVVRAEAAIAGLRSAPRRDRRAFAIQVLLKKRP
jgi:hypothetical protein